MIFESILKQIVDGSGGGIAIALMGMDGIPIAQARAEEPGADPLEGDIGAAGIEFGHILGDIAKAADSLGTGGWSETVIKLARLSLLFIKVDEEGMLVLALQPDGNLGKARYLLRRHLLEIREEL